MRRVAWVCCAINLLLGVHDRLLRLAVISPENIYLLPYGGLAMFGVVMRAMARHSLDPAGNDPLLLLANLRYRLAPRLEAAGITFDWRLHELPELPGLAPAAALDLLRMLQEALANVVKHAQASRVTVSAMLADRQLVLVIADDGVGFDPAAVRGGRGLGNLRRRAESLGARVELDSSPAGTTVRIVLPLQRVTGTR